MLAVKYLVKLYEMPPEDGQITAFDTYGNAIFTGTDKGTLLKFIVEGTVAPDVEAKKREGHEEKNGKSDSGSESNADDDQALNSQNANGGDDASDAGVSGKYVSQKRKASSFGSTAPSAGPEGIYTALVHRLSLSLSRIERRISENVGTFFVSDSQQKDLSRCGLHVICASELNGRGLSVYEFDATQGKHARAVPVQELVLPEPVQVVVTYGNIACIGMRREYCLLSLSDGNSCSVLPLGGGRQPLLAPGDGEVFMRHSQSIFSVSMRSMPSGRLLGRTVQLEDEVLSFIVRHPFLYAFTANYCDVCSLYDDCVTERLPLAGCLFGSQMGRGDFLYAASPTKIWMAGLYSLRHQLADLVERFKVEEAFHLLRSQRANTALDLKGIELELHIMAGFAYLHHCRPKEAMVHFSHHIDPRDLLLNLPEAIPPSRDEYSPELCALLLDDEQAMHAKSTLDNHCTPLQPPLNTEDREVEKDETEKDTQDTLDKSKEASETEEALNPEGFWAEWEGPCPYNTYAGEIHRAWLETYETFPLIPGAVDTEPSASTNKNVDIKSGANSSAIMRQVPEVGPVDAAAFLESSWELFKDELVAYFRSRLGNAKEPYARAMEYVLLLLSLEMQDHRAAHRVVNYGNALSVEDCYDLLSALREYRLLACLLYRRGYTAAARDLAASRVYVSSYLPPHDANAAQSPAYERLPDDMHPLLDQLFFSASWYSQPLNSHAALPPPLPPFSSVDADLLLSTCEAIYIVSRLNLHALADILRESPEVVNVTDEEGNSLLHILASLLTIIDVEDAASERADALLNLVLSGMTLLLDAGANVTVVNVKGLTCLDVAALAANGVFVDVVAAVLIAGAELRDKVAAAMERGEGVLPAAI